MPEEFENAMGHVCIWPTTFIEIYPHHIDTWQLEPTGLLRTRATTMTLVHPDEGEQDRRARELMRELNVDIMGQDVDITTPRAARRAGAVVPLAGSSTTSRSSR